MEKQNDVGSLHLRNTLSLLISKQEHSSVNLLKRFSCAKTCSPIMALILYNRMLVKCLAGTYNYESAYMWLPNGVHGKITKIDDFHKWFISDKYHTDLDASELLTIGKLSGWFSAWKFLFKEGFVRVNRMNKIVVEYPVDDKFYSLEYASAKLKSLLKKKPELDTTVKDSVVSPATVNTNVVDANIINAIIAAHGADTDKDSYWE